FAIQAGLARESQRHAAPTLPAPSDEVAVEALAGGEVFRGQVKDLDAAAHAEVRHEAAARSADLENAHDRDEVGRRAREVTLHRDRGAAGTRLLAHDLRGAVAAMTPFDLAAELDVRVRENAAAEAEHHARMLRATHVLHSEVELREGLGTGRTRGPVVVGLLVHGPSGTRVIASPVDMPRRRRRGRELPPVDDDG